MIRRIFSLCTLVTLLTVSSLEIGSPQAHAQYYPSWGYGYGYAPGPFFTSWRPVYAPQPYYGGGYYSAGYYGTRVVGYGGYGGACCSPCDPCSMCNSCDPCGACSACGTGACATGACGVSSGTQNLKPETDPTFEGRDDSPTDTFDPPPPRTYEGSDRTPPADRTRDRDDSGLGGAAPVDDFNSSGPGSGLGTEGSGPIDDGLGGGDFDRFRSDDGLPPFDMEDNSRTSNKPPMTEPQAGDDSVNLPETGAEQEGAPEDNAAPAEEAPEESSETTSFRQRHLLLTAGHGRHSEVIAMQRLAARRNTATPETRVAEEPAQKTPMQWISAPRNVTRL